MPRRDGTGPQGSGRRIGQGAGQGTRGGVSRGFGGGRNNGGGFGTGGFCVCAKCGEKVAHITGVICTTVKCPKCGHFMVREELLAK